VQNGIYLVALHSAAENCIPHWFIAFRCGFIAFRNGLFHFAVVYRIPLWKFVFRFRLTAFRDGGSRFALGFSYFPMEWM